MKTIVKRLRTKRTAEQVDNLTLGQLRDGDPFRFYHASLVFIAHGNCWYHLPGNRGWSWSRPADTPVVEVDGQGRDLCGGMVENPESSCIRSFT